MEIFLVRHGQPAWVDHGRASADPKLTELGHRQAAAVARELASTGIDEIWVSPLRRAQQTAAPIAEMTGQRPVVLDWLAEARPPSMEGLDVDAVRDIFRGTRRRSTEQWWTGYLDGEPMRAFVERVARGLDELLSARGAHLDRAVSPPLWRNVPRGGRLLIVSHAGTTGAALSHLLGLPQVPWAWERFYPQHASVTRLKTVAVADGVIFSLRLFSGTAHLTPQDVSM